MATLTIIKIVLFFVSLFSATGIFFYWKNRIKKGDRAIKNEKVFIAQKKKLKKIRDKKKKIEIQEAEIEEKLDDTTNDLSDSYAEQLQNKPKPNRKRS